MAFEDVEAVSVSKYWNPEEVGENIEGNVFEIVKDRYNNDRIVLDMDDDADGNMISCTLPGHASLQRFIKNIAIGDYIRVELIEIIPAEEENRFDAKIYKVQKDPDRKIDYDDIE